MRKLLRAIAKYKMLKAMVKQLNKNQSLNSKAEKVGSKFSRMWKSYI